MRYLCLLLSYLPHALDFEGKEDGEEGDIVGELCPELRRRNRLRESNGRFGSLSK